MTAVIAAPEPRSGPQGNDYEPLFEIIDGKHVELPPMSILASRVTSILQGHLGYYLHDNPVGEALIETLFHLPLPVDRNRRPVTWHLYLSRPSRRLHRNSARKTPGQSFPS